MSLKVKFKKGEDFMKCPNCHAEVSEDKTNCGSCEYSLVEGDQDEVGAFIRDAITSPWKSIGRPHSIKAALISVGVMAAVFAAFGIMHLSGGYSDSGFAGLEIVFAVIPSFILLSILFLFGY